MSYQSARTLEIKDAHVRRIDDFARGYKPGRPSVVFLPGGMGSQLDQSGQPYRGDDSIPFPTYDPAWIDLGLVFDQDAVKLEILPNGHDRLDHIIVPNGPVRFLIRPYDETERYLLKEGHNFITFAFDWRRPLAESAGFLQFFLRRMRDRVKALKGEDPLPTTTLLCHSNGGLVAKVFLHRVFRGKVQAANVTKWMAQLITVATPFYGTSNHMSRYYVGEGILNSIYGPRPITRIIGTLPGPYVLMFLDRQRYDRDGPTLGLSRYPVRDADTDAEADPYDTNLLARYPPWVRPGYLRNARAIAATVTRALPDAVIHKVFHLRSVADRKTWVEHSWSAVDGSSFVPGRDASPVGSTKKGPGDGTVPAWSARLAQTPKKQIYDLTRAKQHQELMEHSETLTVISHIIERGRLPHPPVAMVKSLAKPKASRADTEKFLSQVAAGKITKGDLAASDEKIWRRILAEGSLC